MKLQVSAPGKTILHGEHAVVYGKTAIAVSLSLKTTATLISSSEEKVSLHLKNLNLEKEWDLNALNNFELPEADGEITLITEEITNQIISAFDLNSPEYESEREKYAVVAFLYLWIYISKSYNSRSFLSCCVDVESELSVGSGMGSSASYSVCLSTALLIFCGRITPSLLPEDKQLINKWAFETEKIFHGKPSGIDNSICLYGGALLFKNGAVVEMLTNIPNINILLVNTNVPRNTKMMVSNVKQKMERYPSIIENIISAIDGVSTESWKILQNSCKSSEYLETLNTLQDLIDMNQHLLNALGVGHPKLDHIYNISKKHGCSSKLTGGGGGGCAFVILPKETEETKAMINNLKEELQQCSFDVWDIYLGSPGVQVTFQGS